jgi:hypothetical protein
MTVYKQPPRPDDDDNAFHIHVYLLVYSIADIERSLDDADDEK